MWLGVVWRMLRSRSTDVQARVVAKWNEKVYVRKGGPTEGSSYNAFILFSSGMVLRGAAQ